jgi:CubicO group peptidase (beta-lactamase class C family)
MRKKFDRDDQYWAYIHTRLFNKIGMHDALFEVDPTGTQVGSSYIFATVRDYARFGLLYLQDGVFNGERMLPEGWVRYTTQPSSDSKGSYGSSFWLNRGKYYPSAPPDMISCNGYNGQRIFIIPSRDLIIVVVGNSPKSEGGMNFDMLLGDIIRTVK